MIKHTYASLLLLHIIFLQAADNNQTVLLSTLVAPVQKIRMGQNGIIICPLQCLVSAWEQDKNFIFVDYSTKHADDFNLIGKPYAHLWIDDPKKSLHLPHCEHIPTGTLITSDVTRNKITPGSIEYQIEAHNIDDQSQLTLDCIVYPDHSIINHGMFSCKKSIAIDKPPRSIALNTLHMLSLNTVACLSGKNALNNLCSLLPKLAYLSVKNTMLQDRCLTLTHEQLRICKIIKAGITILGILKLPVLEELNLTGNKLQLCDISLFEGCDKRSCAISLKDNPLQIFYTTSTSNQLPNVSINLRNTQIDKETVYRTFFKKPLPKKLTKSAPASLSVAQTVMGAQYNHFVLKFNDCIMYENGEVDEL